MSPSSRGRFVSVGTKLAVATLLVLAGVTYAVYVALIAHEREGLMDGKRTAAQMVTQLFSSNVAAALEFEDADAVQTALKHLSNNSEVNSATVWGKSLEDGLGDALGTFQRNEDATSEKSSDPKLGETNQSWTTKELFLTAPVLDPNGDPLGQIQIAFSLDRENEALAASQKSVLMIASALAALLATILVIVSRRTIVLPLDRLLKASVALQQGDTDHASELQFRSNDEVTRLGDAFKAMAEAIRDRETRLVAAKDSVEQRNQDMRLVLDNVDQGFLTIDLSGQLSDERSSIVEQWFPFIDEIQSYTELLTRVDKKVAAWFTLGMDMLLEGFMPTEVCLDQLPSKFEYGEQHFRVNYQPIEVEEQLTKVLVVISDFSAEFERQRSEAVQKDVLAVLDSVMKDRHGFLEFYRDALRLVEAVHPGAPLSILKRDIHTLKGNCGLVGIQTVAHACHEVESAIEQGIEDIPESMLQPIADAWERLSSRLGEILGETDSDAIELSLEDYEEVQSAIREKRPLSAIASIIEQWQYEPIRVRLFRIASQARSLAQRLNIGELEVHVEASSIRLPPESWADFWSSLIHVIRNALDHGIENPEDRLAAGKVDDPRLILKAVENDDEVSIIVADNGRGINWKKIEEKAKSAGLPYDNAEHLVDAIFSDGVSSRDEVSELSGRGVGLAAIKEAILQLGGTIHVETEKGVGTTFEFRIPKPRLSRAAA